MKYLFPHLFLALILCSSSAMAEDENIESDKKKNENGKPGNTVEKSDETEPPAQQNKGEPPRIGNFSLPTSQQPAMLFAFGGNVIDQGEVQLFFFADKFVGRRKIIIDLIPSVLFGVTDKFSLFFNFPFTTYMRDGCHRSHGVMDCFVQAEYAFYNKSTPTYIDQATIVANITAPTGSVYRNPSTGFGAPSFFIGATYYHTLVDWIFFAAPGAIITFSDNRTKIGNQYLYQFGLGRSIASDCGWIYAWMLELDGQYYCRNRINGFDDHNSGGNILFLTPSLWISSKYVVIQFGPSMILNQNLFGHQRKIDYGLNFNFAWSFY